MQDTKGSIWVRRVVKMIVFFAVLGMIALSIGAYLLNNTFSNMLKDVNPPSENPPLKTGAPKP